MTSSAPLRCGPMAERRERKKQETRQRISDVATALFFERGFEAVTVDEIAAASEVSKMTVFNYFARKEELLLDREDDLKLLPLREAIARRPDGQSPIDALRALVATLSADKHPLLHVTARVVDWWRVVDASPSLQARLRELADEAAEALALELAGPRPGPLVRLAAGVVVLALRTAREESLRVLRRGDSAKKANAALLAVVLQGLAAAEQVLAAEPPGARAHDS